MNDPDMGYWEYTYDANGNLIETDQREDICDYLIKAGALLGLNEHDEDITEQWRQW